MTITWCMVPKIWSMTDRFFIILDHFLLLYLPNNLKNQKLKKNEKNTWQNYHFTHVYHKLQSYDDGYWDIEHDRQNFFVILDHFLPFYPPNYPKNQNFERMKRTGDIIILHMPTNNNNHMIYSSWNMVHEIQTDRWTEVIYRGGCPT